jgi:hypothetical protein
MGRNPGKRSVISRLRYLVAPEPEIERVVVTASRSQRSPVERAAARIAEDTQAAIRQGIAIGNGFFRSPPPITVPVGRPMTPRENYIYNAQQYRAISNQSARTAFKPLAESLPVLGDGLAIRTAVRDPSGFNVLMAAVGVVPLGGDLAAAALRANRAGVKTGLGAADGVAAAAVAAERAPSPSALARLEQGGVRYPGIDQFRDIMLKPGTSVFVGEPGISGFATTRGAFGRTGTDAQRIFEGLQVAPKNGTYRPGLTEYVITQETPAAFSIVRANPQYGSGGLPQLYIPNFSEIAQPVVSYPLANTVVRSPK